MLVRISNHDLHVFPVDRPRLQRPTFELNAARQLRKTFTLFSSDRQVLARLCCSASASAAHCVLRRRRFTDRSLRLRMKALNGCQSGTGVGTDASSLDGLWICRWEDGMEEPITVSNGVFAVFGILYAFSQYSPLKFLWPDGTEQTSTEVLPKRRITWTTNHPGFRKIVWRRPSSQSDEMDVEAARQQLERSMGFSDVQELSPKIEETVAEPVC